MTNARMTASTNVLSGSVLDSEAWLSAASAPLRTLHSSFAA